MNVHLMAGITVVFISVQHVLKDRRVLALVQRQAAEEEGSDPPTDQLDLDNAYVSDIFLKQ